jgi:hypothetical protein
VRRRARRQPRPSPISRGGQRSLRARVIAGRAAKTAVSAPRGERRTRSRQPSLYHRHRSATPRRGRVQRRGEAQGAETVAHEDTLSGMWLSTFLGAIIIGALAASGAAANEHRSRAVAREFQREHPCPSTGLPSGRCPGFWKDHIVPLACGGPDAVSNMQWQTVREAKDAWERRACAP